MENKCNLIPSVAPNNKSCWEWFLGLRKDDFHVEGKPLLWTSNLNWERGLRSITVINTNDAFMRLLIKNRMHYWNCLQNIRKIHISFILEPVASYESIAYFFTVSVLNKQVTHKKENYSWMFPLDSFYDLKKNTSFDKNVQYRFLKLLVMKHHQQKLFTISLQNFVLFVIPLVKNLMKDDQNWQWFQKTSMLCARW